MVDLKRPQMTVKYSACALHFITSRIMWFAIMFLFKNDRILKGEFESYYTFFYPSTFQSEKKRLFLKVCMYVCMYVCLYVCT